MNTTTKTLAALTGLALVVGSAQATTITENFEGSSNGSTTPPAGWSLVTVTGDGTPSYETTTGLSGTGLGGTIESFHAAELPGGYIVNSGSTAFDATQSITGSFNFYVSSSGDNNGNPDSRYPAASFIMGDVKTGFTGSDAGQLVAADLASNTFGARATILDGTAGDIKNEGSNGNMSFQTWYLTEFSWTPSSGTTGVFAYTVKNTGGTSLFTLTANTTLDSAEVYFGFGAAQNTAYGPGLATFDNISITGTEIPEPGSLALLGLGGLLIARRRRG